MVGILGLIGIAFGGVLAVVLGVIINEIVYERMLMAKVRKSNIPGTKGDWIIGDARLLGKHEGDLRNTLDELVSRFGSIFTLQLAWGAGVGVADPEMAQTVYMTKSCPKGRGYRALGEMWGLGLLTATGDLWKRHRKLMQSGFTPGQLKQFVPCFQTHTEKLIDVLNRDIKTENKRIRVDNYFVRATLDIIGTSALRQNLNTLNGDNPELGHAFEVLLAAAAGGLHLLFPFGGYIDRFMRRKYWRNIDHIIDEAIDNGAKDMPTEGNAPRDLLDILLGAQDPVTKEGLTKKEIHDELFIFFVAGHETTALTLSWALYELTKSPDVLAKLVEEVDNICGREMPQYEQLSKLTYMHMCLKETLRLHPPVSAASRNAAEDVKIGGYLIPKETTVFVCIEAIHKRADIWPEPEKFDPLRFTEENSVGRHPMAWIPFTNGVRICIGQHFFWLESKIMLARLLQNFTFTAVPNFDATSSSKAGTTKPIHGIEVYARPRA